MVSALFLALLVSAVFLVAGALALRFLRPVNRVRAIAVTFAACAPLAWLLLDPLRASGVDALIPPRAQFALATAGGFAALSYVYLQIYSAIDCSITIRILVHFLEAGGRPLTLPELERLYPFDALLRRKLDLMVRDGLLDDGESLRLTPRGRLVGGVFRRIKGFLHLGEGG